MASNINPNNIDGTYPVAGQDNNSQGFRDNFTNTKTNFQYAEDEITDLQSKVILKEALSGSTLDNNMLGSPLSNALILDFAATRVALGTVSGVVNVNYAAGHYQTVTSSGNLSLAFSNFPVPGATGLVSVQVAIASAAHTLTLPGAVSVNSQGIQGLNPSTNIITFAAAGTYTFQFITSDGGSSITVNEVNKRLQPLNNSSEPLSADGAINLSSSATYFTTGGSAINMTLAAGVEGQVKVLAFRTHGGGDVTVTVTNPAWLPLAPTGTITLSAAGEAVSLQYINAKWFCIGNNGAVFA